MRRDNKQVFPEIVLLILFPKSRASSEWIYIILPYLKHKYKTDPQFFVSVQDKTESPQQEKLFRTELTRGRQHCDEVSSSLSDVG